MRALSNRRGVAPLAVLLLTAAVAQPAHAQLGGLMRRAAERRVEQKVDDKANIAMLIDPTFDNTTIEITTERLERYIAAMEKKRVRAEQDRAAASAIRDRVSATRDSANAVHNAREEDAYNRASMRYEECRDNVRKAMDAESERKMQAFVTKMQANPVAAQNDPQTKQILALMQEVAAAQSRGDAAASQRATERLQSMFAQVSDSAAIDRAAAPKCNARPAKPASMVRAAALNARADELQKQADQMEGSGNGVKGSEVNMTDEQAAMMWERIQSWLDGMRQDAPITRRFTRNEYDGLVAHRSALRKAFRG